MEAKLYGKELDLSKVSFYSRLCSGSAARSLFAPFSHWGESFLEKSSDLQAEKVNYDIKLCDSILIVSSSEKDVSSSLGHKLMDSNPYREARYKQARLNLEIVHNALVEKDYDRFGEVLEQEAMELHALMMCSKPSFILLEKNSFIIINKVKEFRSRTKMPLYFTIDAGPNIHLIYPDFIKDTVHDFIDNDLEGLSLKVIHDESGDGPVLLNENYIMDLD
jgi:diphosphomevalonate decarboxylase